MTRRIDTLVEVASQYDAIVFDQWGVLHNGSTPYPGAIACLNTLKQSGQRLTVLSNSGKRAAPNAARIADMGFAPTLFEFVMTSGEALWQEIAGGAVSERAFHPIERAPGDAAAWAGGLDIEFRETLEGADAILLMGLPDGSKLDGWQTFLEQALQRALPVFCTNPDRSSPRADGLVISSGALAFAYRDMGGKVRFYGKPHHPVYAALEQALGANNLLMVGDSLEHDIAGAQTAGWDNLLIEGGLYAAAFATSDAQTTLDALVREKGCAPPTYRMDLLS